MTSRSLISIAFAILAGASFGCAGSSASNTVEDTDAGTVAATDAGSTTTVDAGSTTVDAGSSSSADSGSAACTTLTYANFGQAFFATNCNGCHSLQRPTLGTLQSIKTNMTAVKSDIQSGRMPKGFALSSADKTKVLEWLNCGAP